MIPIAQPCRRFPDDPTLFEGLRQNRGDAYECLYQQAYGSFERFVYQRGGNEFDAEDAFQKGITKFYLNVSNGAYQYQPSTRIKTVLFEYCKKIWFDEVGSARVKHGAAMPENADDRLPAEPALDDVLMQIETWDLVERALRKLGEKCQVVIRGFYLEQKTLRELADVLVTSENAAKTKRYECMEKLKTLFFSTPQ